MEADSYSRKVVIFYALITAEIGMNAFSYYIEFTTPTNHWASTFDYTGSRYTYWWFIGFQSGLEVLIACWFFLLIWQTFLFRFGLIGMLCREFALLFTMVPLNLTLYCLEKGLRLLYMWRDGVSAEDVWTEWGYYTVYWIRSLFMVGYYLLLVELSLTLGDPEYYKPDRWLK